ncbi:hypothetical protein LCGC14_1052620 [marine sediment metagenome]|uniref:Uncharacterized protein n=1 Tax=marine sediment metagenome TaxID=412755 RepID=A0A0F9NA90_9ZZZZ
MKDKDTPYYMITKRVGLSKRQTLIHHVGLTYGVDIEWVDLFVIEDQILSIIAHQTKKSS